jgi:hypothetical protein
MCSGYQKLFNRECSNKWNETIPILNTNNTHSNHNHCNGYVNNCCSNNCCSNKCCSNKCCLYNSCNCNRNCNNYNNQSSSHDHGNHQPSGNVDAGTAVNNFIIEYYRNVTNTGWNACLYLFDKECVVFCKNTHVGNAIDMMNTLAAESVRRAVFNDVRSKWIGIDANTVLVSVYGRIQFVGYNERHGPSTPFAETFVLNATNGVVKCTHHLLDW